VPKLPERDADIQSASTTARLWKWLAEHTAAAALATIVQQLRRQMDDEPGRTRGSKMTLDVYAQLEQRVQRYHGTGFDRS
jgi:hypothetical protein